MNQGLNASTLSQGRPGYGGGPIENDEAFDAAGGWRPHWKTLAGSLESYSPQALVGRQNVVRRLLGEHGVTYNVYGEAFTQERQWELDVVPFVLPVDEWRRLEVGLIQRAELLNAILADMYGRQRLFRHGLLPPSLLHANPGFLRACHGIRPPKQRFLVLHAVDLVRTEKGQWWVLGDRTQAPSGAGYALENRIILSQVLAGEYQNCHVQRLAPFFALLRESLRSLSPRASSPPTVVIMTPGPFNETYFEHAYLARYLGFPLVEGADLTVRDRRVYIKTIEGLRPVDVILRRVDDTFCDPLELRSDSFLGVPGLVDALHAGSVAVVNALGSGAMETPSILAFLPAMAQHILGENLKLPNVATWWCGQPKELQYTLDHLDQLVLKRTFAGSGDPVFGDQLSQAQLDDWRRELKARPHGFVGQERVALSTAPLWTGERLEPRPLVLRTFVVWTQDGYRVMAGGLTRVSSTEQSLVVSSNRGGASKDTWVLSDGPVERVTLLPPVNRIVRLDRAPSEVPSRVADNMYWLGRYMERLETSARLLRAVGSRLEGENADVAYEERSSLVDMLIWMGWLPLGFDPGNIQGLEAELNGWLRYPEKFGSLRESLQRIHYLAASLRARLSMDTWRVLQRLQTDGRPKPQSLEAPDLIAQFDRVVLDCAAFSGMEMENMTRGLSWRFLDIGRRIERASVLCRWIRAILFKDPGTSIRLNPLLEICESKMTYRRMYFERTELSTVLDLLLLNDSNPRSLAFQIEALHEHLDFLPSAREDQNDEPEQKVLYELSEAMGQTDLIMLANLGCVGQVDPMDHLLEDVINRLNRLADTLAHRYFSHAITRVC
jgi:uncharacterized circularly permuted ATP-grasp superfamily protein/uncharacterized alpha-E superfamily protein